MFQWNKTMPWLNKLMPNSSKVNFIVFLICLLAHIIDACVLVNFSCADWLAQAFLQWFIIQLCSFSSMKQQIRRSNFHLPDELWLLPFISLDYFYMRISGPEKRLCLVFEVLSISLPNLILRLLLILQFCNFLINHEKIKNNSQNFRSFCWPK